MGGRALGRPDPIAAESAGDGVVDARSRPGCARRGQSARACHVDLRRPLVTLTSKDVAEITRLLEQSAFTELQLEIDGLKISLKRGAAGSADHSTLATPEAPRTAPAVEAEPADPHRHTVLAPLLGTFYRAPKPGAAP